MEKPLDRIVISDDEAKKMFGKFLNDAKPDKDKSELASDGKSKGKGR